MFTQDGDTINITLYYKKNKHSYSVLPRNEFLEVSEAERKKYSELNVKMKNLTWGFYNTLQDISDKDGYKKYKEEKLKELIIEWDASMVKDGVTKKIPVSDDTIMSLHPEIAENILKLYDLEAFINGEQEKKITRSVYGHIMGKSKTTSAITKAIIENDLIEEFHWLPQEIAKIPYRKLQEFFLVRREKNNARRAKAAVDSFKQQVNLSAKRGQQRR